MNGKFYKLIDYCSLKEEMTRLLRKRGFQTRERKVELLSKCLELFKPQELLGELKAEKILRSWREKLIVKSLLNKPKSVGEITSFFEFLAL